MSIYTPWLENPSKELRGILLKALQDTNLKDVKLKPVLSSSAIDEGDPKKITWKRREAIDEPFPPTKKTTRSHC